jgi:hypothetical protein
MKKEKYEEEEKAVQALFLALFFRVKKALNFSTHVSTKKK